jgi:hypothetical protein
MSENLDTLLRHDGRRYHDLADQTTGDLPDVNHRTTRQRRRRQAAAAGTLAVAIAVLALSFGRPQQTSTVQSGDTGPGPAAVVSETPTTGAETAMTTASPSTTASTAASAPSTTAGRQGAVVDIHTVDFRNFTYAPDSCPGVNVRGIPLAGFHLSEGFFQGATISDIVRLQDRTIYGDVGGDGRDDVVVYLSCSTGAGSGSVTYPWVFTPNPASATGVSRLPSAAPSPAELDRLGLHDWRLKYSEATIADGMLSIDWWYVDTFDKPGRIVTNHLAWSGSGWRTTDPATVRDQPPAENR